MSRHTPGPWTVEAPMGDDHPWIVEAGKQSYEWRAIASVHCDGEDIPVAESNANARLIAAAPELLEAGRNALTFLESLGYAGGDIHDDLKAAIVKTGKR